jgi:hypothetical protein
LLVKADVALKQIENELPAQPKAPAEQGNDDATASGSTPSENSSFSGNSIASTQQPRRFHGTVRLDAQRVGRDASKVAEEVIAHLTSLVRAEVVVRLDIEADIPDGTPDNVVRIVNENCRTLKFDSQGFESM